MLFMDCCYLIVYEKTTWENAENECRKEYGSLVSIENKEENSWLQSLITDDAWIGLKDPSMIGSWVWSYDNSKITFENWGPLQPNGDGYCACFCTNTCSWNEHYWNDRPCDYPTGYICKKSIIN
ncbi:brevican core protein-like [Mytilus trossulus]|uniref:brevican core protein-like n=1 Tax=Mytilus trossulus TaxID=6551 RepID=UPI0030074FC8